MTASSKCEAQVDLSRNLLRMSYRGHVAASEMKAFGESLESLLPQLRKGFTILTDLGGLDSMELDCLPELTGAMDRFKALGVGTVIRIVPDPRKDIGFNILSVVHYRRGVRVVTCTSAAEAEKLM